MPFSAKLVPLAYGIKKLTISCVVEDDKVSIEELEEQIAEFEDYVSWVSRHTGPSILKTTCKA